MDEGPVRHDGHQQRQIHRQGRMGKGRGVTRDCPRGDFVASMGASGSGKSTLLNLLGGLDRPTSGHYILDGVDVSQMDDAELSHVRNQKLGFIFQSYNLIVQYTVLEN